MRGSSPAMPPTYHFVVSVPLLPASMSRPIARNSRAHAVPSGPSVAKRSTIGSLAMAMEAVKTSVAQREERQDEQTKVHVSTIT